jgi:aminoglycoside 3-N-acetyltransferase
VLMLLGVSSGRTIFVHSSLGMIFGKQKDSNKFLYDCLNEIVGDSGTIVVPTFTNNCYQGLTFDPNKTESELGILINGL